MLRYTSVCHFLKVVDVFTPSLRHLNKWQRLGIAEQGKSRGNFEIPIQPRRRFSEEWDFDVEKILNEDDYQEFSDKVFRLPQHGHNVCVIQPYVKNLSKYKSPEEEQEQENRIAASRLQLEEAVALIQTLPKWKVSDSCLIGVPNFNKTTFFGSNQIERVQENLSQAKEISAVFVSVNILRVKQIIALQQAFNVPVFDRYTIVIQIFRQHAATRESKLQVAMAELPYLKQCMKGFPKGLTDHLSSGHLIGGSEKVDSDTRREMLMEREKKLKKALGSLRQHRQRLRANSKQSLYPIVAVVGYTNAGKTSLIKALTGTSKLVPRNQLFATLDVTKHEGTLPCSLKVLYLDTIGFITDIPTALIESFTATLEDAMFSDVIIHVCDVSHPDYEKQRAHVMSTLARLDFGENLNEKVFVIGNKVDCAPEDVLSELKKTDPAMHFVSAKTGYGMVEMLQNLQKQVINMSGRTRLKIRVKTGGEEYVWLQREMAVEEIKVDSDHEHTLFTVVTTKDQLQIFKHKFLN